ncbi:inositol monophosphatase family protein [Tropicimonas sp. TH_r6]|uniref:inositol monophosphatase family protein n=1 Tax=Tropicimonas sp. TH_r6 TaxID=3082085 RepID=UPI002954B4EC|nr:inositol monophosphatase family protein [Tropicimonas sp. TH_r6]MDV7145639.1 inositol monophosphatase family protein [Tropicimonas sp. TH_r6]
MKPRTDLPVPAELLAPVADAVLQMGVLLRSEFYRPCGPRGRHGEALIDREIARLLKGRLLALYQCGWHDEELPREPAVGPDSWVVDPQDGTRAFLKGLRGSAISVALVRDGMPVLGVVYAPTAPDDHGDFFAWAENLPPTRNGEILHPIAEAPPFALKPGADSWNLWPLARPDHGDLGASRVIAYNDQAGDFARANHARISPARFLAVPSIAYRLALAAAGDVDAGVSLTSGLDPYDIAGGHAILRGVGGELLQLDGKSIKHGPHMRFRGCIGGRPGTVAELVRRELDAPTKREPRHPAQPARRTPSALMLSGAQGTLLGQLAGDALGSAVEFQTAKKIRSRYPDGVRDLVDGGHWNTLAGQPTDDSEMALALARCLVTETNFDINAIGRAYIAWGESAPFDIGSTTAAGLAALGGRGQPRTDSESNGALMRVSPIGVFAAGRPDDAAQFAAKDAGLTHPNSVCIAASSAFAAAISAGVAGADSGAMISVAVAMAGHGEGAATVRKTILRSMDAPPERCDGWDQGHVLIALANAFHRLHRRQNFEDALVDTVAAGGDTDTNAAIAGALLGAAQGRQSVPLRWRHSVLSCRAVDAREVCHPRPKDFWPDDALDLAEALLNAMET